MAAARLVMRKTREILRQKWELGLSHRKVARCLGVGVATISETVTRALVAGLGTWRSVQGLDDATLEERLYGRELGPGTERPKPGCSFLHTELRRPGVTLQLLHLEYLEQHSQGYRYSQFCEHHRRWVARQRRSMRQVDHAGEKLFVDYAGRSRITSTLARARSSRSNFSSRRSALRTTRMQRRRGASEVPTGSRVTCAPSSTCAACPAPWCATS